MDFLNRFVQRNIYYIRLTFCALLAFAGTYYALPTRGLVSTLPIFLIAALISVLFKLPAWQKAFLFGLFAFILTLIEYDTAHALGFATICIIVVFLCSLAYYLMKKKKASNVLLALLLIAVCTFPHAYFFGNIVEGMDADKILREYTDKRYASDDMTVSQTFYDYKYGFYKVNVYSKNSPTEIYSLSVQNGFIYDSYRTFAKKTLMHAKMLEITTALRESFPNENFEVIPLDIIGYPYSDTAISLNDSTDYSPFLSFRIDIWGQLDLNRFLETSESYYDAIMRSEVSFDKITFSGKDRYNILKLTVSSVPLKKDFTRLLYLPPSIGEKILAG